VAGTSRRQFIARSALLVAAGAAAPLAAKAITGDPPPTRLRKLLDIGPGGVISPGSAQDLRSAGNVAYLADTRTPWIRMWADWPSLQPHPDYAPDDPLSPGRWRLYALDEQIRLAGERGLSVLLMPYRFPTWVNGTAELAARKGSREEIAFRHEQRMAAVTWERYARTGRGDPSRRALEYGLPADAYGPTGAWAGFFAFLYDRYHAGRETGPRVAGFELVNEPNLQLWPQAGIAREIARLLQTAQGISVRRGHSTMLYAPSISDDDAPTSARYTRWDEFVPALMDELAAAGYRAHSRQAWSHHNYTDVERRRVATNTQAIRALLAGRWSGHAEGRTPTVFVTEGGARLSRMPELYPAEDPGEAQARCVREAWTRHLDQRGAGAGVAMHAQYLLHADPNFDCGLLDPYPSTRKRPAYAAWRAFPVSS
jgi:hypothetical protein